MNALPAGFWASEGFVNELGLEADVVAFFEQLGDHAGKRGDLFVLLCFEAVPAGVGVVGSGELLAGGLRDGFGRVDPSFGCGVDRIDQGRPGREVGVLGVLAERIRSVRRGFGHGLAFGFPGGLMGQSRDKDGMLPVGWGRLAL